ncbi:hypothetical protein DL764_007501 [Monosporascus ibericus]|uniref:Uncharacterized protein n=1 Tax=Monosporascus ibericus TaxID=155417 RepID=A0A4Q4T2C7_9PEZI|nr:hypothetical protein DL764_007501 [Monosporascus ibericus]
MPMATPTSTPTATKSISTTLASELKSVMRCYAYAPPSKRSKKPIVPASKRRAPKRRSRANYPAWVAARRALMQVYYLRPAGNAVIECRLVPGNDSYQLWALAKRMFRGKVSAAVTSALGPAQEAVDMATFPLRLDDF